MATFSMTGAALMAGLEYGVSDIEGNYDEFLIQVSGMQYSYNPLAAPFSRVSDVLVDGQPLESDKTYTIAGNEFVPVFLTAVGIPFSDLTVHTGITEFQTLMAYVVGKAQPLSPLVQGRIVCAPETPSAKLAEAKAKEPTAVALPAEFRLDQNYPNPFNPTTTVAYDLPAPVHVRLTVYNMLGQEVAQLVSADQAAGRYTALWNASGYASGLYIMRLEAGPYSAIRKMQLVK